MAARHDAGLAWANPALLCGLSVLWNGRLSVSVGGRGMSPGSHDAPAADFLWLCRAGLHHCVTVTPPAVDSTSPYPFSP